MKADRGRDTAWFVQPKFRAVSVATGNKPKSGSPELPFLELDHRGTKYSEVEKTRRKHDIDSKIDRV